MRNKGYNVYPITKLSCSKHNDRGNQNQVYCIWVPKSCYNIEALNLLGKSILQTYISFCYVKSQGGGGGNMDPTITSVWSPVLPLTAFVDLTI